MPDVGITDGPPPCARDHQAEVLSCSHVARRWATLERHSALLIVDAHVKVCSRETHSPSQASKIYGYNAFQITHLHTPLLSTVVAQDNSPPHTLWGCWDCSSWCGDQQLKKTPVTKTGIRPWDNTRSGIRKA